MRPHDASAGAGQPQGPATPGTGRSFQTQIGGVSGGGQKLCPKCEGRYGSDANACPRDGMVLVEIDGVIGSTLSGTYFVRRLLGEGAMGKVYEARHTRIPAKRFAIKMLQPELVFEPQVLGRFAREAEAAATIDHPNVVTVVDVDRTAGGEPFIVSEYLEGCDLGTYLERVHKMPVAAAVRIVRQVVEGLTAAHARGIIHRDVKPENVFLTGDPSAPTAKVLDFGISRLERREGRTLTGAGTVLGTPSFMPPEQARGDRVDQRADVYAVGAILYMALTGQCPFERDNPTATLLAVLDGEPARPRSLDPSIPATLEMVILRAMAREPAQRYTTMAELSQALAPFDTQPPAQVPQRSVAPPARAMVTTLPDDSDDRVIPNPRAALIAAIATGAGLLGSTFAAAIAGVVHEVRGQSKSLSDGDAALVGVLAFVLVLVALGPPIFFTARGLAAGVLNDPVRASQFARRVAPSLLGAVVVYGIGSAAVRGIETTLVWRPTRPATSWDVVLLLLGLAGAALPMLLRWVQQRGRST